MLTNSDRKDREILKKKTERSIQIVFEEALKLMAMLIPEDKYKLARSRILGVGNDQIRFINKELDKYLVRYEPYVKQKIEIQR